MDPILREFKTYGRHLALPKFYSWLKKLGIGFTPAIRIPKRVNPFDENIPILAKLEYTNFGESVKARPFAMMYYHNSISGKLTDKTKAIAATSGNFGLAGSFLLRDEADFTVYMSEKAVKENKGLTLKLQKNKTRIETFSDRYCPTVAAKRGEAIAAARYVEKTDLGIINYDQYDDVGNPLSHFLTTAPEIYYQTSGRISHFVASLGTCGTMIGCGYYLRKAVPGIKIIGLIPQEGHHQLGLRSREELGATRFFEEAKKLCDEIMEVSDKDAYNAMLDLWKADVPAGISSGTNCYGALKVAEQLHDENKRGLIVTIIPDSCENYGEFLRRHLQNITGLAFGGDVYEKFEKLKTKAREERREHMLNLKNGRIALFKTMRKNARDPKIIVSGDGET
jgi:cysteine synthase